jgi:hypothetical protein
MATRRAYSQPQAGGYASARIRKVLGPGTLPITTTDLVTGGVVVAARVPQGFTVTGINAVIPDMDTGATLTLSIGDSVLSTRLVNASTAGQAGGSITTLAATGNYYTYPNDTDVLLTVTAGPAGATAGSITNFYIEGFIANP